MNLHGRLAQTYVACRLMLVACRLWLVAHRFLSVVYCPCDNLSQVCNTLDVSIQMSIYFPPIFACCLAQVHLSVLSSGFKKLSTAPEICIRQLVMVPDKPVC